MTLPSAPTYSGYGFTGWNTASDGSGTNYSAGASYTLSGSVMLYAQWASAESTTVGLPSNGATVSGSQYLDASASSGVTKVHYELTGGGLNDLVIATGTPTTYGWIAGWNTTTVLNGAYTLQSVGSYSGGVSGTSLGISVTVSN